jgi:hypothetical protein
LQQCGIWHELPRLELLKCSKAILQLSLRKNALPIQAANEVCGLLCLLGCVAFMTCANDVSVRIVSAVRLRYHMVKLASLSADGLQAVEAATGFARQQYCYEAAIGEEVKGLHVEVYNRRASGHDSRNFRGEKYADKVAIARAVLDFDATAFVEGTYVLAHRTLSNADGVREREDGDQGGRFAIKMRVPKQVVVKGTFPCAETPGGEEVVLALFNDQ